MPVTRIFFLFFLVSCSSLGKIQPDQVAGAENSQGTVDGELHYQQDERVARLQLRTLAGKELRMEDYKGKVVFLNFWATWCKPCLGEMNSISEAAQQFDKEEVIFLAASNEPADVIEKYARQQKFEFEIVRLDQEYIDVFVISLPTTFLIDRLGRLVHEDEGARDWNSYNNVEKIKSLLNE